jgi:hypothetical protein
LLKDDIQKLLHTDKIELYAEEKEYAITHQLIPEDTKHLLIEKDPSTRFADAYIERADKESENLIAEESGEFLKTPLDFLKKNSNEFLYLESNWFTMLRTESVSLELDDVFKTYDVMLELKLQKKMRPAIEAYLTNQLERGSESFDLLFNQGDGLWDLNFSLNDVKTYKEDLTIGEAFYLIYQFMFTLIEQVEEGM